MPSTRLNETRRRDIIRIPRLRTDRESEPPECAKSHPRIFYGTSIAITILICVVGIRYFTEVFPEQYCWSCNNTNTYITSKTQRKYLYFKVHNWNKQKFNACNGISSFGNLEEIKNSIESISTWLFRIAAVLLMLSGILCYYQRQCICWEFGLFAFIFISPIFINAFLSLYDFYNMSQFGIKCF